MTRNNKNDITFKEFTNSNVEVKFMSLETHEECLEHFSGATISTSISNRVKIVLTMGQET